MCKRKRFFRILAVALTLALLLVAIPAPPALAAPYAVNVENNSIFSDFYGEPEGTIGDALHVWGTGSPGVSIDIYFSSQEADVTDNIDTDVTAYELIGTADISGIPFESFNVEMGISVPAKLTNETTATTDDEPVHSGIYYVYITTTGSPDIKARTTFTISGVAEVEMDKDSGPVGTEIEITGEDFAPDEDIILEYDGDVLEEDYIVEGDLEANEDGEFSVVISIPESTFGEHTITVIGEDSDAELELTFTVEPEIIVDPVQSEAGVEVTVTGTGFDYRNGVDFYFGGTPITNVVWLVDSLGRTNSYGTFIVNLTIPDIAPPGSYVILAEDEDDNDIFDDTFFTVWPTTTPTPTITITTTITATTTTTPAPTTITVTTTTTPAPTTITVTSTAEPTTVTPPPTTKTVTATITPTPLTTTIHTTGDSQVNIWLPIASALGAIVLMLIGFIVYFMRSRGL